MGVRLNRFSHHWEYAEVSTCGRVARAELTHPGSCEQGEWNRPLKVQADFLLLFAYHCFVLRKVESYVLKEGL